jgi:predicted permease
MLLIAAGLLLTSFGRVLAVDPGFAPDKLLTARVAPPASRYPGDAELRTFTTRFLERLRTVPGVVHAGMTTGLPFGGDFSDSVIFAEGYQMAPGESLISPYRVSATAGYMEAIGMPVLRGRTFTDGDTDTSPRVVIVDEKLAKRFWPDADPVGRRMYQPDSNEDLTKPGPKARWYTVVGVVGTTKMAGLVTSDDRPGTYYFPMSQDVERTVALAIRTAGDPAPVTAAIRRELHAIDPELPLYSVRTMQERMDETLTDRRTPMILALVFAAVALFLAAVGIYGVLAYQVSQRSKEIGIRMALGSDRRGIFGLVIREGMALLGIGLAAGLALAAVFKRTIEAQLYQVSGLDPAVVLGVAAVLGIVALTACAVPARRAARTDPLSALNAHA